MAQQLLKPLTALLFSAILAHVSAVDFCAEINSYLPSECSCSSQNYGATVGCVVNFFDVDTIGITGELELCNKPATATIKVNDTKFGISHELAGLVAGRAIDVPIPGLDLDIPDIGSVGVNAAFDIEGDLENLEIKLGLDACGKVLSHSVCGSKLTDKLPLYVLDHTFDFGSLCKQARKEAGAADVDAAVVPLTAVQTNGTTTYVCTVCNHVYNAATDGAGIPFEKLPASWTCPVCGSPKSAYKPSTLPSGDIIWSHDHDDHDDNQDDDQDDHDEELVKDSAEYLRSYAK
tara:strand:+ start:304 stop:1173 length:870 start_codon:yes stop_codon:yes gene_type:complete